MIQGRNIICLSSPSWEGNYASTTVELMKVLASNNKVLFVNNPFTLKDVIDGLKSKKNVPVKKVFGFKSRIKKVALQSGGEIYVLTPPMILSINFLPKGKLYNFLLKCNGLMVRRVVRQSLKRLDMNKDLVNIVSLNPAMGLINGKQLNEKLLLYLCYDEIGIATYVKKHGAWMEEKFSKIVDAVIVTSQGLYETKKYLSPNCFLVKNAANVQLFGTAFNSSISSKKQIGFIGSIDKRTDYDLMQYLIEGLPQVEFTFIGRVNYAYGEQVLRQYKNVKFEGPKNIEELPAYVKSFSVGIIPFLKTDFNKGIYPLKINEYLAAGIPVVTTNFSHLKDFESVIRIAETKEEFRKFIVEEIETDSIEKKIARQNLAKENSWEHRADELSGIIDTLEKAKDN